MLTIADLDGPWIIELRVPDDRIGHVLEAEDERTRSKSDEQLAASFLLATEPGKSHVGKVEKISLAADTDKTPDKATGTTVEVTVSFDRGNFRPTSSAQAPRSWARSIAAGVRSATYGCTSCGRRSNRICCFELW